MQLAKERGREYERQAAAYHRSEYGHQVWEQPRIPEDKLVASGFIHDYNAARLMRLAEKKEQRAGEREHADYGMDFLAYSTVDKTYHPGQAKFLAEGRVTAAKIGTFVFVRDNMETRGFLYSNADLEANVSESKLVQKEPVRIVYHKLPPKPVGPFAPDKVPTKAPEEAPDEGSVRPQAGSAAAAQPGSKQLEPEPDETGLELRDFQREAVEFACGPQRGHKVLEIFCSGGKTLIAGHALRQKDYRVVLCLAPLIASVDQLRKRLSPFLSDHDALLFDSQPGGTTNLDELKTKLGQGSRLVIYSTFKSASEKLSSGRVARGRCPGGGRGSQCGRQLVPTALPAHQQLPQLAAAVGHGPQGALRRI